MPVHKAIDGVYDRGELHLDQEPSFDHARVTVIFYEPLPDRDEELGERRAWLDHLATMLPPEAAEEMARNIEEAFEQVEEGDW